MTYQIALFKSCLQKADILIPEKAVKGSFTYLDYGLKIRSRLYNLAMAPLRENGFFEVKFSDILKRKDVEQLDTITPVSSNYFPVEGQDFMIAAGHEASAYAFLKNYLKLGKIEGFPIKFFHFGSVYRYPKKSKFPFSLGERRSFLECYIAYTKESDSEQYFEWAATWNRYVIRDILHLPAVEVLRPLITNKPLSRKTVCIDTINPLGVTVITGMTYFHDDLFTKAFNISYKDPSNKKTRLRTVHFGITDNLFFSYLLNCFDGDSFLLLNDIAPYHVAVLVDASSDTSCPSELLKFFMQHEIRFSTIPLKGKSAESIITKNAQMGIPLSIFISSKTKNTHTMSLYYRGKSVGGPSALTDANIQTIRLFLERNDTEIKALFRKRELETIVRCSKVSEVNQALSQGKIACISLKKDNKHIIDLESKITSGEILGFGENQEKGADILTSEIVETIAYVSKRV